MIILRIMWVITSIFLMQGQVYGAEPKWGGIEVIGAEKMVALELQRSLKINVGDTVGSVEINALRSMCELAKQKLSSQSTNVECQMVVLETNDIYVVVGVDSSAKTTYGRSFDLNVQLSHEAVVVAGLQETQDPTTASGITSYSESLRDLLACAQTCGDASHRAASITLILHRNRPSEEICQAIVRAMTQDPSSSVRNSAAVQLGKPLLPCVEFIDEDELLSAAASLAVRSTYSDRLKGLGLLTRFKPTESVTTGCGDLRQLQTISKEAESSMIELMSNVAGHARSAIDNAIDVKRCP